MTSISTLLDRTYSSVNKSIDDNSLRARCARSGIILATAAFFERGMRFVRNMILARLLAKDDFGLMAIIFVAAQLLEASTDAGVKPSIIQNKQGSEEEYLNAAWWFQALRGTGLFATAFLVAPLICQFYKTPDILGWLRFSFLAVVFNGLLSPRSHVLEKNFRFGKVAILTQGGSFLGIVLTIVLAVVLRDVSALVIGYTAEPAFRTLLSYILCPFRPSLRIDRNKLCSLLQFAKGALGLPLLSCIAFQADVIVLGRMVTKAELGMYYLAVAFVQLPVEFFRKVIGTFLLPAFAETQGDLQKLRRGLLEITRNTALLCMPFITFLAFCAGPVLKLAYGAPYAAAAVPFAFLACYILTRTQGHILGLVFLALGKPHIQRRCVFIRLIIILVIIYPATLLFGLCGAAAAVLFAELANLTTQVFWTRRTTGLSFIDYIRSYQLGLLTSLIVLIVTASLKLLQNESLILSIGTGGVSCAIAYFVGFILIRQNNK